ncbi:MAG: hypothetical protein WAJ85_06285 [Candidatus Baltobacteraceae bacterium]
MLREHSLQAARLVNFAIDEVALETRPALSRSLLKISVLYSLKRTLDKIVDFVPQSIGVHPVGQPSVDDSAAVRAGKMPVDHS